MRVTSEAIDPLDIARGAIPLVLQVLTPLALQVLHTLEQHLVHGVLRSEDFKIVYVAPMKALAAEVLASSYLLTTY